MTKWTEGDYESAACVCEQAGLLIDADGAYADMFRYAGGLATQVREAEARWEIAEAQDATAGFREAVDAQQRAESALAAVTRERETAQAKVDRYGAALITLCNDTNGEGPWYDDDCPGDDTCSCSFEHVNDAVNEAYRDAEAAITTPEPPREKA